MRYLAIAGSMGLSVSAAFVFIDHRPGVSMAWSVVIVLLAAAAAGAVLRRHRLAGTLVMGTGMFANFGLGHSLANARPSYGSVVTIAFLVLALTAIFMGGALLAPATSSSLSRGRG